MLEKNFRVRYKFEVVERLRGKLWEKILSENPDTVSNFHYEITGTLKNSS